jgi:hypothetical protein
LTEAGVGTVVLGAPSDTEHALALEEYAAAGRRPSDRERSYFSLDSGVIDDAIYPLRVKLVRTCAFEFPEAGGLPPSVLIECEEIPPSSVGEGGQGGAGNEIENWTWDAELRRVELQGDICERVKRGVERVDLVMPCPTL